MYLRDIVKAESGTQEFLESIKQDFVISNEDLALLTKITQKYRNENPGNYNYFIFAATYINKISNTMNRIGVPKEAGEQFRLLTPIYEEFYKLRSELNLSYCTDVESIEQTKIKLQEHYKTLLQNFKDHKIEDDILGSSNRVYEMRDIATSNLREFNLLGKYAYDNLIASHCMGNAAEEVFDPLHNEIFTKF